MTEEKQQHGTNRQEDSDCGDSHANGRCQEKYVFNFVKLFNAAPASFAGFLGVTGGPQTELGWRIALNVTDPLGGDEGDDPYDGVAYREDGPEHPDRLRVPHVGGGVYLGRFNVLDFRTHHERLGHVKMARVAVNCENHRLLT